MGEDAGRHLGVGGGGELVTLFLKVGAQDVGVDKVAVVSEGELAIRALNTEGLGVLDTAGAGGGVAVVAYRDVAGEVTEVFLIEDLGDEAHSEVEVDAVSVGCGYTCALLPSVLERIESVESDPGDVFAGSIDPEDAAIFPGAGQHAYLLP
jgi:hypothetical protein